jgi:small nuclear ribonucleoprotein (snRNP)-like protein
MYPGVSSFFQYLDKKVLVNLRDERNIVGYLTSYDQFGTIFLEKSVQRITLDGKYNDVPLGLYIIKSDSVAFICEIESETLEPTKSKIKMQKIENVTKQQIFKRNGLIMLTEED